MYGEDIDLCWRLGQLGWIVRYEPSARVRHNSAAATRQAFGTDPRERFMSATYAVIARRQGLTRARLTAAINVAGCLARLAWMLPLARLSGRWRASLTDTRGWLAAHRQGLRSIAAAREEG
jgi:GT2 family glycosyltransferase